MAEKKGQTTTYKTVHRKLKIKQHEPDWKREERSRFSGRVSSSWSTSGKKYSLERTLFSLKHYDIHTDFSFFRQIEN
jgi:hypothetical protein